MTDLFGNAAAWLDAQRVAHLSRRVTYRRGEDSVEIDATPGSTTYEVADEAGAVIGATATDFIISAGALVLDGQAVTPRPGDRIVSNGAVFEVLDLAGQGCWRWCGPHRTAMRIHAKEVGTE